MKHNVAFTALVLASAAVAHAEVFSLSFQNGANAYTGQANRLISSANPTGNVTSGTTLGVDGWNATDSPDVNGLIRFDNIFGAAVGQIPAGATIINARLTLTSQSIVTSPAAESGGPWGVASLFTPWDAATTYTTFASNTADAAGTGGNRGPWFANGTASRALAGIGVRAGTTGTGTPEGEVLEKVSVNITPFAQAWSKGTLVNNGVAVQAGFPGTTDGWIIRSGSHGSQASHPKLDVTYTTDAVSTVALQQGVNSYAGTTMARVENVVGTPAPTMNGADITTDSPLDRGADTIGNPSAVIKFDGISGLVPAGSSLISAYVVISTGTSVQARTNGEWAIDKLANAWDSTTLSDGFSSDGVSGTRLSTVTGVIAGGQALFDVTTDVAGILAGTSVNNGWSIYSTGTGDGWNILWTGNADVAARPQLLLTYATAPVTAIAGDYNRDGYVDAADYTVWADSFGMTGTGLAADGNSDSVVDAADYTIWADNFGRGTPPAGLTGAVPEPTALAFAAPVMALLARRRR